MIKSFAKNIHWIGRSGFRINAEETIYFDPYQIEAGPPADLILTTHQHFDHCSPEDVSKIQGPETAIVTEKDSARRLSGDVKILRPGESLNFDDIEILAVPACDTDKYFHPKRKE